MLTEEVAFQELEAVPTLDQEVVWLSIRIRPGRKVVLCAAYRPGSLPGNDISMVDYLDQTIDVARVDAQHLIIAGDFNAHNTAWLGSSRTTPAGEKLEDLCALHHLQQHVMEPTRGNALLDLIMSDLGNPTVRLGPPQLVDLTTPPSWQNSRQNYVESPRRPEQSGNMAALTGTD